LSSRPPHPFADNPLPAIAIQIPVTNELERWRQRYGRVVGIDETDTYRLTREIQRIANEGEAGWELLDPVPGHDPAVTRYDGPHTVGPVTFTLQYVWLRPLGRDMLLVIGIALERPPDA
jgi:hypothetical protein